MSLTVSCIIVSTMDIHRPSGLVGESSFFYIIQDDDFYRQRVKGEPLKAEFKLMKGFCCFFDRFFWENDQS
ncbi:hypothetical protein MU1_00980 [Paenibacillus glycanilyticus]|uniref:Uncharacterized protein n=1 Tax=Paenibacillus glycanilyticus TaxID=126569 RepID=A0ABQ6G481_9BACL|nr:hypothetical protein MU1_00980 [Paenibacillus glycanilyticus]